MALRVTLIHNQTAGDARHRAPAIVAILSRAGYCVTHFSSKTADLGRVLELPADLVAIAGGDGTVAKVAAAAKPTGCPLAILPLGSANNIARSLGIDAPIEELVSGWKTGTIRPFHLVHVAGPWGRRRVVEGIGVGAFARVVDEGAPDKSDIAQARSLIATAIEACPPEHLEVYTETNRVSGDFLFFEITNIAMIGPNLCIAPAADPSDDLVEICFVRNDPDQREAFLKWLLKTENDAPAPISIFSSRKVTISGKFQRMRMDDKVFIAERDVKWSDPTIVLEPETEALPFLVPR